MFLFRLKHEFQDNKRTFICLLTLIFIFLVTVYSEWNSPLEISERRSNDVVSPLLFFALLATALVHIHLTLGKELYLQHTSFWNTRPIRGKTLFSVKWLYLQLTITLPIMVTVALLCLLIQRSDQALPALLEYGLISLCITSALTYSTLAIRAGRYLAIVIFGATLTVLIIIISIARINTRSSFISHAGFIDYNPLAFFLFLTVTYLALTFFVLRKRHHAPSLVFVPLSAIVTVAIIVFQPFTSSSSHSQTLAPVTAQEWKNDNPSRIYQDQWSQGHQQGSSYLSLHLNCEIKDLDPEKISFASVSLDEVEIIEGNIPSTLKDQIQFSSNFNNGNRLTSLQTIFYQREPSLHNYGSSSGSLSKAHPVYALPRDHEIKVAGILNVSRERFKTLVTTPVTTEGAQQKGSLKYRIELHPEWTDDDITVKTKQAYFDRILILDRDRQYLSEKIIHPNFNEIAHGGGGYRSGSSFGRISESSYRLRRSFGNPAERKALEKLSVSEILAQCQLEITQSDHRTHLKIPIEFTLKIPDPEKVIELIKSF